MSRREDVSKRVPLEGQMASIVRVQRAMLAVQEALDGIGLTPSERRQVLTTLAAFELAMGGVAVPTSRSKPDGAT